MELSTDLTVAKGLLERAEALQAAFRTTPALRASPSGFRRVDEVWTFASTGEAGLNPFAAPEAQPLAEDVGARVRGYEVAMSLRASVEREDVLLAQMLGGTPPRDAEALLTAIDAWRADSTRMVPPPDPAAYPGLPRVRDLLEEFTQRDPLKRPEVADPLEAVIAALLADVPDVRRAHAADGSADPQARRTMLIRASLVAAIVMLGAVLFVVLRQRGGTPRETDSETAGAVVGTGLDPTGPADPVPPPPVSSASPIAPAVDRGSRDVVEIQILQPKGAAGQPMRPDPGSARIDIDPDERANGLRIRVEAGSAPGSQPGVVRLWPAALWREEAVAGDRVGVALPAGWRVLGATGATGGSTAPAGPASSPGFPSPPGTDVTPLVIDCLERTVGSEGLPAFTEDLTLPSHSLRALRSAALVRRAPLFASTSAPSDDPWVVVGIVSFPTGRVVSIRVKAEAPAIAAPPPAAPLGVTPGPTPRAPEIEVPLAPPPTVPSGRGDVRVTDATVRLDGGIPKPILIRINPTEPQLRLDASALDATRIELTISIEAEDALHPDANPELCVWPQERWAARDGLKPYSRPFPFRWSVLSKSTASTQGVQVEEGSKPTTSAAGTGWECVARSFRGGEKAVVKTQLALDNGTLRAELRAWAEHKGSMYHRTTLESATIPWTAAPDVLVGRIQFPGLRRLLVDIVVPVSALLAEFRSTATPAATVPRPIGPVPVGPGPAVPARPPVDPAALPILRFVSVSFLNAADRLELSPASIADGKREFLIPDDRVDFPIDCEVSAQALSGLELTLWPESQWKFQSSPSGQRPASTPDLPRLQRFNPAPPRRGAESLLPGDISGFRIAASATGIPANGMWLFRSSSTPTSLRSRFFDRTGAAPGAAPILIREPETADVDGSPIYLVCAKVLVTAKGVGQDRQLHSVYDLIVPSRGASGFRK